MADAGRVVSQVESGSARFEIARWPRSRRRWLLRFVCLVLALLGSLSLVGFITVITYRDAPSWITDVQSWRITGRLSAAGLALVSLQLILAWGLGLLGAIGGAAGFTTRGALRPRLIVQRRKMAAAAWALLGVRLALLLILLLAGALTLTPWLGHPFDASELEHTLLARPLLPVAAGCLLLVHLVAGPWLRLRYSLTLGALAAAYTSVASRRRWSAVTARLAAGLAGILTLIWGSALGVLAVATAFDPFYTSQRSQMIPRLFPHVPSSIDEVLTVSLVIAVGLGVYLAGQIVLPGVTIWLAERRGGRRRAAGREAG